jgi:hypothetical protein
MSFIAFLVAWVTMMAATMFPAVGSAVNDTTREPGGTLGAAIVGSVFASIYSSRLAEAPAVQALPEETRAVLGESMAAAQAAAPACRRNYLPLRPVDRIAGSRGYRTGRGGRRRLDATRPGATNSTHHNRNRAARIRARIRGGLCVSTYTDTWVAIQPAIASTSSKPATRHSWNTS